MEFFVHLRDPGFPDSPWPGERRLGPFLTSEEAANQAVSDLAGGYLADDEIVGIYAADESEKRTDDLNKGKAVYVASRLRARAATARKRAAASRATAHQETEEALKAMLPDGLTWKDLQALATDIRHKRMTAAREEADAGS